MGEPPGAAGGGAGAQQCRREPGQHDEHVLGRHVSRAVRGQGAVVRRGGAVRLRGAGV